MALNIPAPACTATMFSHHLVAFFAALLTATVVSTASSTLSLSIGGLSDKHALINDEAVTDSLSLSNPLFTSSPASDLPPSSDRDESEDTNASENLSLRIPNGSINNAEEQSTFSPPSSLSPILTQASDLFLSPAPQPLQATAPVRRSEAVGPFSFPDHITGPLIFGRAKPPFENDLVVDDNFLSQQIGTVQYYAAFPASCPKKRGIPSDKAFILVDQPAKLPQPTCCYRSDELQNFGIETPSKECG